MYQLCPRCKKLVSEYIDECPFCEKELSTKYYYRSTLWWCNSCEMYVDPGYSKKGAAPEGTSDSILAVSALLSGNIRDAIQFSEIGSLKRKVSNNPNNYVCPKCGGKNLQKKGPKRAGKKEDDALKILKKRFASGEISKSDYLEMKKLLE